MAWNPINALFALPLAEGQMLIERLHPVLRARVLLALLALIVLGMGLIALTLLGARFVRRYGGICKRRKEPPQSPEKARDEWWQKPLVADSEGPAPGDEGG
jgi:hypothetical protein